MEKFKKIALWCLTVLFLVMGIGFLPSISGFIAFLVAVILAPVQQWQDVLSKILKGKVKGVVVAVLVVVMIVAAPNLDVPGIDNTPDTTEKNVTEVSTTKEEATTVGGVEDTTDAEEITTESAPVTENGGEVTTDKPEADVTENQVNNPTQAPTQASTQAPPVTEQETKPVHAHSFKDATCTAPKTCTSCGATEGSALGHSYSNGKCTRCGANDPNYVAEEMVWIPKSGSKYHCKPNCGTMKNPTQVTKSEAESRGYGPCGNCY